MNFIGMPKDNPLRIVTYVFVCNDKCFHTSSFNIEEEQQFHVRRKDGYCDSILIEYSI